MGIWAVLLLALLGGRRGFGGFDGGEGGCCGGHHDGCHTAEKELEFINTSMNSRFNETNAHVANNANAAFQQSIFKEICDTTANIKDNIGEVGEAVANASFQNAIIAKDAQISALECCCNTNRNIDNLRFDTAKEACGINRNVDQLRFDNQLATCGLEKQLAACCCETQMGLAQVRFEAQQNKCEIMANDTANAQRIIDKMTCNEIQELRDKLQNQKFENSQLMQNNFLVSQLRPCPIPAFPSCNPWGCNGGFGGFDGRRDGFRDGFRDGCCGCI